MKKKLLAILLLATISIICAVLFVACNNGNNTKKDTYSITLCPYTDSEQIHGTQRFDRHIESVQPLYPWYAGHRGERSEPPDRVKGMTFTVIPFCWIVKFSGITRFLYKFWKFSSKYCIDKEKDHNILWSKWYSRREYFGLRPCADCVVANPQRPLRSNKN